MVSEKMNRVCVVLTGVATKMRKSEGSGVFIAGIDSADQVHLTAVVVGIQTSNRHQMGLLVNSLREQDETVSFSAVGMCLSVALTDSAAGKSQEALYVCLEDRFGSAEDLIFLWKKKLFGGWELERPTSRVVEPRVYGRKGDDLVALVKEGLGETIGANK